MTFSLWKCESRMCFFVTGIKDFVIFTLQPKKLKMERQAKMLIKKIALLIKPSSETVATPSSSFFSFFFCVFKYWGICSCHKDLSKVCKKELKCVRFFFLILVIW